MSTKHHNRDCPKCGSSCVGCIFEDVKEGYETDIEKHGDVFWTSMGVCCSQCDWELQLRSSNS